MGAVGVSRDYDLADDERTRRIVLEWNGTETLIPSDSKVRGLFLD